MATVVRWEPFREIATLQNEVGRLLSAVAGSNGETTSSNSWMPALDVWEEDDKLVYAFDLPGVPEDKVSVEFEDGALTVSGERERSQQSSEDRLYRYERRFGSFSRTIGLPQGVSEQGITAECRDGVLEVHVAKPAQPKPRRIQIGTGKGSETIEGSATKA